MAAVWALGTLFNVEVPDTLKVLVEGRFPERVLPKDLILHLIGAISAEGANFKVIEFHGPAIKEMSTSGRLTICNMTVEAGATSGIVPPDGETTRYLRQEAGVSDDLDMVAPDGDADYARVVEIDASTLAPQIACPHTVDNVKAVGDVKGVAVNQIVIGSCTNGRLDDLEVAAKILKGRRLARGVRMLVFPASWRIYREALKSGYLADLVEAGAVIMNRGWPRRPRGCAGRQGSGTLGG
jgi:3-isopropylmalate/(R)-2-methylmalate dehydratase large subunit